MQPVASERRGRAAAALAAASSFAIAELLTGSTRPSLLVASPPAFVLVMALYGCGVLTVRELTVRWGGGWATLLALGAAFGVVAEGLVARSVFDPSWGDLGALGSYGRWAGVNWVWTTYLTIFHAVFSVAIPVALARIAYPQLRDRPWLSDLARWWVGAGLIAAIALGALGVNPGAGSPIALGAVVAAAAAFAILGRGLTGWRVITAAGPSPTSARRWAAVGCAGSAALFLLAWVPPTAGVPAPLAVTLLLAAALIAALAGPRVHRRSLDRTQTLALIAGALGWLAAVDLALAPARPDTAALVALAVAVLVGRRRAVGTRWAAAATGRRARAR